MVTISFIEKIKQMFRYYINSNIDLVINRRAMMVKEHLMTEVHKKSAPGSITHSPYL